MHVPYSEGSLSFWRHSVFLWAACSHFGRVRLSVTLRTVAHQALLSMGFSRQEQWSGPEYWRPFPLPGNLPDSGIEPPSLTFPVLAGGFFTTSTTWEAPIVIGGGSSKKISIKRLSLSLFLKMNFVVTPLGRSSEKEHHLVSLDDMASEKKILSVRVVQTYLCFLHGFSMACQRSSEKEMAAAACILY